MVAQLQAQRSGPSQRRQLADTTRRALERSPLYSEELGIGLAKRSDAEYFRWFLASLLFGDGFKRVLAKNAVRKTIARVVVSDARILGRLCPGATREGNAPRCRSLLKVFKAGGRTAYCCPQCQGC